MPGFDDEGPPLDNWESGENPSRPVTMFELNAQLENVFLNYRSFTQNVVDTIKERDAALADTVGTELNNMGSAIGEIQKENARLNEDVVFLMAQMRKTQLAVGYMSHLLDQMMRAQNDTTATPARPDKSRHTR